MAKELGKTSLCGVRHVGDGGATEDKAGEGGRKEEEEFRSQGPRGTTVWEARVMGLQELVPPIT